MSEVPSWHLMPAAPAPGTFLCKAAEIADGAGCGFRFSEGSMQFALFVIRYKGVLRSYLNQCPHARHPLDFVENRFFNADKTRLLCGSHGAEFEPQTGLCVAGPCKRRSLTIVPVVEQDGSILVGGLPHGPE